MRAPVVSKCKCKILDKLKKNFSQEGAHITQGEQARERFI